MSDLPKRVTIDEEGPREGFQSEKKAIPVSEKVRLIEALAETGLKRIACVSYVNPRRVPTMADAEQVAAAIRQKPGIQYAALWLNQQGLERALAGPLHVDGGVRVTASDTFSRKNIGKSVPDSLVEQRMSLKTFKDRGMPVEWGVVLGAFGCNYEGELSTELILQRAACELHAPGTGQMSARTDALMPQPETGAINCVHRSPLRPVATRRMQAVNAKPARRFRA